MKSTNYNVSDLGFFKMPTQSKIPKNKFSDLLALN